MNKAELVNAFREKISCSKVEAEKAIEAFLSSVEDGLKAGEKVQLIGFGTFEVKNRAARKGRNPQTGEEIDIPAAKVPHFTSGKGLRAAVNI